MKEPEAEQIAGLINGVVENIDDESAIEQIGREALLLCSRFPVPEHFIIPSRNQLDMMRVADRMTRPLFE